MTTRATRVVVALLTATAASVVVTAGPAAADRGRCYDRGDYSFQHDYGPDGGNWRRIDVYQGSGCRGDAILSGRVVYTASTNTIGLKATDSTCDNIGLTLYTLLVLTRNMVAGLNGVPDDVREAARGMGFGPLRMLLRVELPLALPTILAGVRIATVTTVAEVTVCVVVSNGGLGQLLFAGLNNNLYRAEIATATVLCVLLALVLDLLLLGAERLLTPWARR